MTTTTDPTNARLLALADQLELEQLATRLGRWLDDGLWDDSASVFTTDVTVRTPGGESRGIEAVTEQARRNHESIARQHVITNVVADVDGDRATVTANLVVRFAPRGAPSAPTFEAGERYRWDAVRTADGWRFATVAIEPVWMVGEPPRRAAA